MGDFWFLSRSRPAYFGAVGFIPLTEIEAYARINEVDDVAEFVHYIRGMDAVYTEATNKRLAKKDGE